MHYGKNARFSPRTRISASWFMPTGFPRLGSFCCVFRLAPDRESEKSRIPVPAGQRLRAPRQGGRLVRPRRGLVHNPTGLPLRCPSPVTERVVILQLLPTNSAEDPPEFVRGEAAKSLFPERETLAPRRPSLRQPLPLAMIVSWYEPHRAEHVQHVQGHALAVIGHGDGRLSRRIEIEANDDLVRVRIVGVPDQLEDRQPGAADQLVAIAFDPLAERLVAGDRLVVAGLAELDADGDVGQEGVGGLGEQRALPVWPSWSG